MGGVKMTASRLDKFGKVLGGKVWRGTGHDELVYVTTTTEDVADKPDDLAAWLEELDRRVKALEAQNVKRCAYCGSVLE